MITRIVIGSLLLLIVCMLVYLLSESSATWQQKPLVIPVISPTPTLTPQSQGDPAAIYCTQINGTLIVSKSGEDVCMFSDGSSCPKDLLFAGTCKKGNK